MDHFKKYFDNNFHYIDIFCAFYEFLSYFYSNEGAIREY